MVMKYATRPVTSDRDRELYKYRPRISAFLPPSEATLERVQALEEGAARSFWFDNITNNEQCLWHRQLPREHWAQRLKIMGPYWYPFSDIYEINDPATQFLRTLPWEMDQPIFFIRACSYTLQTVWRVFLDHWRSFLINDDDPFVLAIGQKEFLFMGDFGVMGIGQRPMPLPLDSVEIGPNE
jgi:hypothetical protein